MTRFQFAIAMLLIAAAANTAVAEDKAILTIERLYAAPDLDGPSPKSLAISPDSSRVTFLRGKDSDPLQMDLWEYNIAEGKTRLLVDSMQIVSGPEDLSDEELARRERLRIVGQRGIVSYKFSPDGRLLLFPLGGDLYLYRIATGKTQRLTETGTGATDPKFSSRGRYVSYVHDQNLYVIDIDSGEEQQITRDGGGLIKNGMAEFIAQEEMDRYTGYWWSPDDSAIAFARVDESPVQVAERFEIYAENFSVYEQRYPATGTPNARIRIGVATPGKDDARWMDLGEDADIYVPRVEWFPDSKHLAIKRQTRDQKTLELLKADVDTGVSRVLLTETSDTWINLHNELKFLESSSQFIWASARTGYTHLYLYGNEGELVRPLTSGEWEVVDGARATSALLHADEKRGVVYATATKDSPMERNVYAIRLDGTASPQRVSRESGWHRAEFSANGEFYVDRFDNVSTPQQVSLHRADGSLIGFIEENRLDESHPYYRYLGDRPSTEFGTLQADDGQDLYYRMIKPADFDPEQKYPVIVYVYGGPMGQQITNTWAAGFLEILARNGFIVFSLDNRGTGFRGVAFDTPLYRRLGAIEIQDQMTGVQFLDGLDYVDADRIGVWGWSYGGYMTLMCLLKEPQVFAAGVSGAPVTDWTLYDTHYTERYLGTPQNNAGGYESSSIFPYVDSLARPLLLIHGMADDNVLYTNSTKLYKALQDSQRDFDIMAYPGGKHGLTRVPSTGTHALTKILQFFRQHLT